MFVAQAHSFVQQARLAITLAWVAGYTNIITILDKNGKMLALDKMSKIEAAHRILDHVKTLQTSHNSRRRK